MFQSIKDLLPKNIARKGLARSVQAGLICKAWEEAAKNFLPGQVLEKVEPLNFRDGVLTLSVTHPAYGAEVMNYREQILKAMGDKGKMVKRIRFKG